MEHSDLPAFTYVTISYWPFPLSYNTYQTFALSVDFTFSYKEPLWDVNCRFELWRHITITTIKGINMKFKIDAHSQGKCKVEMQNGSFLMKNNMVNLIDHRGGGEGPFAKLH